MPRDEHSKREPKPGRSSHGSTQPAKTIITTFNHTGVNAATAKRR